MEGRTREAWNGRGATEGEKTARLDRVKLNELSAENSISFYYARLIFMGHGTVNYSRRDKRLIGADPGGATWRKKRKIRLQNSIVGRWERRCYC